MGRKVDLHNALNRMVKHCIINNDTNDTPSTQRKRAIRAYCKIENIKLPLLVGKNISAFILSEYNNPESPIYKGRKASTDVDKYPKRKKRVVVEKKVDRRKEYNRYLKSAKWKNFKKRLIKERGKKCQVCNEIYPLDAHHITYERIFNERDEDILLVCRGCHQNIHNRKF